MLRQKSIIISIVTILTGSCLIYFNGYKDNGLIKGLSYLLILLGWLILAIVSVGQILISDKKITFKKNKIKWLKQKSFRAFCYLTTGFLVVGNMILVSSLTDKRVSRVLRNDETRQTIAIVTKLEVRNSRGGAKPYAIISYQTFDKTIEQAIYNGYEPKYLVGQRLLIKYSLDHPEMFAVVSKLKGK